MIRMSIQSTLLSVFITVFSTQALAETCETNPGNCTPVQLCEKSTEVSDGKTYWTGDETNSYLKVARQFGLDCGALDVLSSCQRKADMCSIVELCDIATTGKMSKVEWNKSLPEHVKTAKSFGLICGVTVPSNTAPKSDVVTVSKTPAPTCEEDITGCDAAYLCDAATYGLLGAKDWKRGSFIKFVDEAKRRGLSCGVLDLEQILFYKSDVELCSHATHESSKGIRWNVGSEKIFVEQAKRSVTTADVLAEVKRRSLDCNIKQEGLIDLDVAQIQTRLHHFGYEPGIVDGAWGGKTEIAFKQFLTDNSQSSLSSNSLEAETFLYDLYEQKFEQTVRSSVPCKTITKDYERTNTGTCVVIAHFDETSSNLVLSEKGDETTGIWDKRGIYPAIRKGKDKSLEFVMWAPDQPVKPWTKHGGPGLAHMVNLKFDINEVFEKKTELAFKNNSRKMPFSVRRYELNDLDNDGLPDLFLLGSREDGRGEWNKPRIDKVPSNMIDYNFIYDFERDRITTFGEKTFSHDFGIHDFDNDGFKDILDMTLSNDGTGYFYCDGKTLNCAWRSTDQFINGQSFLAYDSETKKVFLNARCGKRYVTDHNGGKFWLCWFSVEGKGPKLQFKLIQKLEFQKPFDAKIKWMTFFGEIKPLLFQGWKVDGYSVDERIRKSAGGTATAFKDLDGDGDLDMITHRKDYDCVKKDLSRNYYNFEDCDQFIHSDYIFLQNDGKFELSEINEGGIRDHTIGYDFEDLNKDGHVDIIPRGVYQGKCVDTYENILMNSGNGTFNRTDEKFSGRYGCELASNFFEHKGQRYRAFTFKPEVKEHTYFDFDVYLAIEKLQ